MIVAKRASTRTSVRQAIIALHHSDPGRPDLSRALALDIVATLGAVNGFSLAFAVEDSETAKGIAMQLPAGVDLRVQIPTIEEPFALALAREYAARDFERIIVVAADTIGLSARLLSTTASALATDSPILGPAESDGLYLAGVSSIALNENGADSIAALMALTDDRAGATPNGRRLERLARLRDVTDEADVEAAIERQAKLLPRAWAVLRERGQ